MQRSKTIARLNRLVLLSRECERLCGSLARCAPTGPAAGALWAGAQGWGRLGDELQALVLIAGGAPAAHPGAGAILRGGLWRTQAWVRAPREAELLARWQALQQQAAKCYEAVLATALPERIRRTLTLQLARVRTSGPAPFGAAAPPFCPGQAGNSYKEPNKCARHAVFAQDC